MGGWRCDGAGRYGPLIRCSSPPVGCPAVEPRLGGPILPSLARIAQTLPALLAPSTFLLTFLAIFYPHILPVRASEPRHRLGKF